MLLAMLGLPGCIPVQDAHQDFDLPVTLFQEQQPVIPTAIEDDPGAVALMAGQTRLPELPVTGREVSEANQNMADDFLAMAAAFCQQPCILLAAEERPEWQLQADEQAAIAEHAALMKSGGQTGELVRLKRTIMSGNLYVRALVFSDKPAEFYMLRTIRESDERIAAMPDELLMASVQTLTIQIRNRDDALKNFEQGMYGAYQKFAQAELQVLIQLRRSFLDEIRKRGI